MLVILDPTSGFLFSLLGIIKVYKDIFLELALVVGVSGFVGIFFYETGVAVQ